LSRLPPSHPHKLNAKPVISVALCTRNGAKFIQDQVRSICEQGLPPAQLVISDDASSDGCVELARQTVLSCQGNNAGIGPALDLLRNDPPLNVTKNFEQAVKACSGEFIALSDQDDVWHKDRLSRMVAEFDRRPNLLLLHADARLIDDRGRDLSESLFQALEVQPVELAWLHHGRAMDVFLRRNLAAGTTIMFRRALLRHALPFPPEWVHDEWLAMIAAALGGVDVLEEALTDYRQHASNQIGAKRESLRAKIRKAFTSRDRTLADRAVKAEILLERLLSFGDVVSPDVLEKLRGKVAHQRFRATLPAPRWRRWLPVLREAASGRYSRFGRAVHCVARDLLESG
jgi:glycosyltransferase involved in cell wall biosynthesis